MSFATVTLKLDRGGIVRRVLVDCIDLGPHVRNATVRCQAQDLTILTVEFVVDEVITERVESSVLQP